MAKYFTRTMNITKVTVEGFNTVEKKPERRGYTLFTEPDSDSEILTDTNIRTEAFIPYMVVSKETREELRQMSLEDFYRKSKPVEKKAKEAKAE